MGALGTLPKVWILDLGVVDLREVLFALLLELAERLAQALPLLLALVLARVLQGVLVLFHHLRKTKH